MNNKYQGKKFNIETIQVLNAIIGTFIGFGSEYEENPSILQKKTIIPSYELKKENKVLFIIVKLPNVTNIEVNTSIENKSNTVFNFVLKAKKEGKDVALNISLPYHEYLVTDPTVDNNSLQYNYGKLTVSFPLLL